ncbi:MAG: ribosome biogenesis protein [Thaumarchaeota archaeon]|nr:ribosome biogenesis protein [Nitrososphaerota archaeon]
MLNLVLAESALELIPGEIRSHPAIVNDSKRRGKSPSEILLDRSLHHAAMLKLKDGHKRGRPDLVHSALLSITCSPVFLDGEVKLYVHTFGDVVLDLKEGTRLPKSYDRFRNLMEKSLAERASGDLIRVYGKSVVDLFKSVIRPSNVVALSIEGKFIDPRDLARELVNSRNPALVIGGFPHGHFDQSTIKPADEIVRIHERSLDAHVVASRMIYEVERATQT